MFDIISCLDPKTVLSQWYPTKDLYLDRPVEGIYLLLTVPSLPIAMYKLPPKALVVGSATVMEDLKRRIVTHYTIGDSVRKEWTQWFDLHSPTSDDIQSYIRNHRYLCPLISFFREGTHFVSSSWKPTTPVSSFSIFPSTVVVALPSVQNQFDPHNAFPPFTEIGNEDNNNADNSAGARYIRQTDNEMVRLKNLKVKGSKEFLSRQVKSHGASYALSGSVADLSRSLISIYEHFFHMRYICFIFACI